ncbi:PLDc N-terminal domain-containing protein [Corynebacterium glutamicum]|uniref:PLDc N-terminal domain-containing protein n=1 Tax=Corynebacterium glutamicum TaxID=1718 RepID=UPI003C7DF11A
MAITVATVEYTRKRDVVASLGWGALVLFLPIIGFVIWAVAALIRRENLTAIKG